MKMHQNVSFPWKKYPKFLWRPLTRLLMFDTFTLMEILAACLCTVHSFVLCYTVC